MKSRVLKSDWDRVADAACEVVNAVMMDDPVLSASKRERLMDLLDELERKYGERAIIAATRGDFLEDLLEARKCLERALELAIAEKDSDEELEIGDSLKQLDLRATDHVSDG
ncbi:MAG: hypothetical protein ABIT37_18695 [Luteolibacter sp.]